MSNTNDSKLGNAYSDVLLQTPTVRPIDGFPNNYVVDFGDQFVGLRMHVTRQGWRQINAAVEEGFSQHPVDIIDEYVSTLRGQQ